MKSSLFAVALLGLVALAAAQEFYGGKLLVLPAKAYRHVHDPITVTAIALNANHTPIANASVVLAVYGDCDPLVSRSNYTTNAAGQATFTIISTKPGALSAVAALVDSKGLPVVSYPAHIIYFDEHSYIDEREEQYYGPNHHKHNDDGYGDSGYKRDDDYKHGDDGYGDSGYKRDDGYRGHEDHEQYGGGYQGDDDHESSGGVGYRGDDLDDDKGYSSDAETYAAAAKKAALQQIGSKAVTQHN